MKILLFALLFVSETVIAITITGSEIKSIENFIRSDVEWSYTDVSGEELYTRVNDRSFAMKFGQDNGSGVLKVKAIAEVETNFYGEVEVGSATCDIIMNRKDNAWKVDSFKSFCKCDAGIQCGEGNLYDE